jgi:hypothetical protein
MQSVLTVFKCHVCFDGFCAGSVFVEKTECTSTIGGLGWVEPKKFMVEGLETLQFQALHGFGKAQNCFDFVF